MELISYGKEAKSSVQNSTLFLWRVLYVCDTWNLKNVADVLKKKKKENVSKVLRYLVKIEVVNVKNKLIKCENEESELRCWNKNPSP